MFEGSQYTLQVKKFWIWNVEDKRSTKDKHYL